MTRRYLAWAWSAFACGSMGCGSDVESVPAEAAGATSGTGGSSVTSSTTGSGAAMSSSSRAASSGQGAGGGGGANGCSGAYVEVSGDGATTQHLTSVCGGSWGSSETSTPVGYVFSGGPAGSVPHLIIDGCASSQPGSVELRLSLANASSTGMFSDGDAQYHDAMGLTWTSLPQSLAVNVTAYGGGVGDLVSGQFKAIVTMGGDAGINLSGTFAVCHVSDENVP